ncbi:MAG: cob(I)yrinic acid a,c-diamide adenosyltransferase [Spirochaetaceae bacterium]
MDKLEFTQVTTRGGDRGESSLADGERRRKDDYLFEALGTLDELASYLGVVRALTDGKTAEFLLAVQKNLQVISGMAAVPSRSKLFQVSRKIDESEIESLEREEALLLEEVRISGEFVTPGNTVLSAHVHVARTICRRAERRVVTCIREQNHSHLIPAQRYINRLADYLFVLAVLEEQRV